MDNPQHSPAKGPMRALRNWFVFHCIVDLAFAIPLMFFPDRFLDLIGWPHYDPITARMVAAALFGIGLESYLGRNRSADHYQGMLRLKVIWSLAAAVGILLGMLSLDEKPVIGWVLMGVFAGFNGVWVYWWRRLPDLTIS